MRPRSRGARRSSRCPPPLLGPPQASLNPVKGWGLRLLASFLFCLVFPLSLSLAATVDRPSLAFSTPHSLSMLVRGSSQTALGSSSSSSKRRRGAQVVMRIRTRRRGPGTVSQWQRESKASESYARREHARHIIRQFAGLGKKSRLLSREEEYQLGVDAQRWIPVERARLALLSQLGREPTVEEWAREANIPIKELNEVQISGRKALNTLIVQNLGLVISIVRKYEDKGVQASDLVQEGTMGLMRAVEKFDPHRGCKFSTYATWWIQNCVLRFITHHARLMKVPQHVQTLTSRYRKLRRKLEDERQSEVEDEELAAIMGTSTKKLKHHLQTVRRHVSFEEPIYPAKMKGEGSTIGDTVITPSVEREAAEFKWMSESMHLALRQLRPEERMVLRMKYGLDDGNVKTLREIAEYSQVTMEYVKRTQVKAITALRINDGHRLLDDPHGHSSREQYYAVHELMKDLAVQYPSPSAHTYRSDSMDQPESN